MHVKRYLLRVAAATTVTAAMSVGFVGEVHAADDNAGQQATSSDTASSTATDTAAGSDSDTAPGNSEDAPGQDGSAPGNSEAAPGQSEMTSVESDSTSVAEAQGAQPENHTTGSDHSAGTASTQGDVTKPQPESNADKNDVGANTGTCGTSSGGPYCSTRDGSASENGLGDGNATGRPAAGSVGKADNKNPRGQLPGPQDRNRGYECDMPGDVPNQGIAEGNPAHTGCKAAVAPPQQPPTVTPPEQPPTVTPPQPPAVVPPPQQPPAPPAPPAPVPPTPPQGEEGERPRPPAVVPPEEVLGVEKERPVSVPPAAPAPTGVLPAAGAEDNLLVSLTGVGLLIAGGALIARRRPQSSR